MLPINYGSTEGHTVTKESPRWSKSTYSENGGQCVEIAVDLAATHGVVPVRDSKTLDGPALAFRTDAFAAFISGVRNDAI